jgi:hypothetical protein
VADRGGAGCGAGLCITLFQIFIVMYDLVLSGLALFRLGLFSWFRSGFSDTTGVVVVVCFVLLCLDPLRLGLFLGFWCCSVWRVVGVFGSVIGLSFSDGYRIAAAACGCVWCCSSLVLLWCGFVLQLAACSLFRCFGFAVSQVTLVVVVVRGGCQWWWWWWCTLFLGGGGAGGGGVCWRLWGAAGGDAGRW